MKLLLCKNCQDIIRLIDTDRLCQCGAIGGKYTDSLNAVYFGDMAVPIGFANSTLTKAIQTQPEDGMGENFTAFVIPKVCTTYRLVSKEEFLTN